MAEPLESRRYANWQLDINSTADDYNGADDTKVDLLVGPTVSKLLSSSDGGFTAAANGSAGGTTASVSGSATSGAGGGTAYSGATAAGNGAQAGLDADFYVYSLGGTTATISASGGLTAGGGTAHADSQAAGGWTDGSSGSGRAFDAGGNLAAATVSGIGSAADSSYNLLPAAGPTGASSGHGNFVTDTRLTDLSAYIVGRSATGSVSLSMVNASQKGRVQLAAGIANATQADAPSWSLSGQTQNPNLPYTLSFQGDGALIAGFPHSVVGALLSGSASADMWVDPAAKTAHLEVTNGSTNIETGGTGQVQMVAGQTQLTAPLRTDFAGPDRTVDPAIPAAQIANAAATLDGSASAGQESISASHALSATSGGRAYDGSTQASQDWAAGGNNHSMRVKLDGTALTSPDLGSSSSGNASGRVDLATRRSQATTSGVADQASPPRGASSAVAQHAADLTTDPNDAAARKIVQFVNLDGGATPPGGQPFGLTGRAQASVSAAIDEVARTGSVSSTSSAVDQTGMRFESAPSTSQNNFDYRGYLRVDTATTPGGTASTTLGGAYDGQFLLVSGDAASSGAMNTNNESGTLSSTVGVNAAGRVVNNQVTLTFDHLTFSLEGAVQDTNIFVTAQVVQYDPAGVFADQTLTVLSASYEVQQDPVLGRVPKAGQVFAGWGAASFGAGAGANSLALLNKNVVVTPVANQPVNLRVKVEVQYSVAGDAVANGHVTFDGSMKV
ncbi:MAG TPA: hypothetical protein VF796_27510 [Humisphaera sp.]